MVWRSVRVGGDTKTRKSHRTLELPRRCVDALRVHHGRQDQLREQSGNNWQDNDLVFASRVGTELYAGNVRRSFRLILADAGLDPAEWTPHELRHTLSHSCPTRVSRSKKIARIVGHTGTTSGPWLYAACLGLRDGMVRRRWWCLSGLDRVRGGGRG